MEVHVARAARAVNQVGPLWPSGSVDSTFLSRDGLSGRPAGFMGCPKSSFSGVRRDGPLDGKTNPPYPPLTGGHKKAKRPAKTMCSCRAEGVLPSLTPLSRGGRGGCLYPVCGLFQQPRMRPLRNPPNDDRRGGPVCPPVGHVHPDTGQARRPVPTNPCPVGSILRITKSGLLQQPREGESVGAVREPPLQCGYGYLSSFRRGGVFQQPRMPPPQNHRASTTSRGLSTGPSLPHPLPPEKKLDKYIERP